MHVRIKTASEVIGFFVIRDLILFFIVTAYPCVLKEVDDQVISSQEVEAHYEESTLEEDGEHLDVTRQVLDGEIDGESTVVSLVTLVTCAVAVASKSARLALLVAVDRLTVVGISAVQACEAHVALALALSLPSRGSSVSATVFEVPAQVLRLAGVSDPAVDACAVAETFPSMDDSSSMTVLGIALIDLAAVLSFIAHEAEADAHTNSTLGDSQAVAVVLVSTRLFLATSLAHKAVVAHAVAVAFEAG